MIVVIGTPWLQIDAERGSAVGLAARIAVAAARAGAQVQLVGKVGDDAPGDQLLLALAREDVGHVAVLRPRARTPVLLPPGDDDRADADLLEVGHEAAPEQTDLPARDPALALEAGDLKLGLDYLVDFRAIVVAEPLDPGVAGIVAGAAAYAGAHVIVVGMPGSDLPELAGATVFAAEDADPTPGADPDGALAGFVASFAVAVDRGEDPADALEAAVVAAGVERVEED
ncbi:MAG TPA: PfkB family carbohydrate kinase [Candidatus Limnocylindrales bacterium]|nr:PfkB family carbohydrate kinase [Candidatus Limnocylindrales bacterium]